MRDRPNVPDIDGYLSKLKHHKPRFTSSWTRRWFRTLDSPDGGLIEYYNSKRDAENRHTPKHVIKMSSITSVQQFDDLSFQINVGKEGSYLLRAESMAQMTCWVPPIKAYVIAWSDYSIERIAELTTA